MKTSFLRAGGIATLLVALPATATMQPATEFADLSIEELAKLQITSVSKKPEPLARAAAAFHVITADDIRRSGFSSLPEVLRLAPNLHVGKTSNGGYAISARGLNGSNNSAPNKLQVLVDGRSVYAPLFSGVFWDAQDLMLEDVERIEVISGPGGTLWGANAVNGVINITTRAARDSTGSLAVLSARQDGADALFRQGGAFEGGHWRVYGKYVRQRASHLQSGVAVNDGRHQAQVGFRSDWDRGQHRFTVHGNAYRGTSGQPQPGAVQTGAAFALGDVATSGINLTVRWSTALADGGSVSLQAFVDHTERSIPPTIAEKLDIVDLQFQHSLAARGAHTLVWGAIYRPTWDDVTNSEFVAFLPARVNQQWASLFAQDEIALRDDLRLTAGARIEKNPYTGLEWLPTLRLAWTAAPAHTVWASASRTVRAPSRLDADAFIPGRAPFLLRGGPVVRSEVAKLFELGYRGQPHPLLSYAMSIFHNDYDHLRTQELDPSLTFVTFGSLMEGKAKGLELWGNFQATPAWRLSAGLTALDEQLRLKPGSNDAASLLITGKNPSHTAQLRSHYNLSVDKEIDMAIRKVGKLSEVPGYTSVDARFGWTLRKGLMLSVMAHNLNGGHGEYGPVATRTEVGPSLGIKLLWQQ